MKGKLFCDGFARLLKLLLGSINRELPFQQVYEYGGDAGIGVGVLVQRFRRLHLLGDME